jgi:heme/copper-type cytochrome/quinol oxidase subunit 4
MDPTKLRMRYLIGIFLAAAVTAAALRHFLHVQAGFAPEEIRTWVLIIIAIAIFLVAVFFHLKRRP